MLRDGKSMWAVRLPVPSCQPGKAMGDVRNLDVERGRIEQVEPSSAQHALPGAGWFQRGRSHIFQVTSGRFNGTGISREEDASYNSPSFRIHLISSCRLYLHSCEHTHRKELSCAFLQNYAPS